MREEVAAWSATTESGFQINKRGGGGGGPTGKSTKITKKVEPELQYKVYTLG